jgi:DNA primase
MKFPPSLLDDIRARLQCSQVVGRKVALKKAGREYKGLSPFKSEKTPSFYVNDQKGFYHCFASGEHGDIFKFVMKTEGLTFPEAVERLAEEAGVPMPKFEPRDQEREDERTRLLKLMEDSASYFENALKSPAASNARRYIIETRGLSTEIIAKFRLGYAPNSRNALKEHLAKLGYSTEEMIASGMLIGGDDIPVAYDRFRNRVMFPITDLKNRTIAFGGRALEADAPAKYLNSPETPLFHKGHILFHAAAARPVAHDRGRVIAVEGYMDVVALTAAGFSESVAPLGTALTEDQAKLLWRMADEPILCFDGDAAGKKAAFRAIDTVLPHLVAGKSVRIAFLPDGLDPDDLIRQDGPGAMEAVLQATKSLADVLFDREWSLGDWSTPERRAKLEHQIFGLVARIADESVRGHYAQDMRNRLTSAFGAPVHFPGVRQPTDKDGYRTIAPLEHAAKRIGFKRPRAVGNSARPGMSWPPRAQNGKWAPPSLLDVPLPASEALRQSQLGTLVTGTADVSPLEALIGRTLINHPWMLEDLWEDIARLKFESSAITRLKDALLDLHARNIPLDTGEFKSQLTRLGFGKTLALIERSMTHRSDRFAEPDAEHADVITGWAHAVHMHGQSALRQALVEAQALYDAEQSQDALDRIEEIKRLQARPIDLDDRTQS